VKDRANRMDRRATGETGQTRRIIERERRVENRRHRNKRGTVWKIKEVSATGRTGKKKGSKREARDCE
jgi:hypothetical protein